MISVIIPLYNKADYIKKSVQSVLQQSFRYFELVIVNDGSTDNSLNELLNFTDSRISIISQENAGVSVARNNGVKKAKYDFIAFLDADDWWDPHYLEEMFSLIRDFPEASVFGCQYYWVKGETFTPSVNPYVKGFRGYIDYVKAYIHAWWMPLSSISVVIDKATFQKLGGFKEELKFGEDFDLWIRFALYYKVAYFNKPLAYYNQNVSSTSRALGNDKLYNPKNHFIFNLTFLRTFEESSSELKCLLDGLRVRNLTSYYTSQLYISEVNQVLGEVVFQKQPFFFQLVYSSPIWFVRSLFRLKFIGSHVKQTLKKVLAR
ncbi:glycosyltransferase family 2 protein [Larkinella harenae]